jgi:hypothetical protein
MCFGISTCVPRRDKLATVIFPVRCRNAFMLDVWSRALMVHSYRVIRRMRFGHDPAYRATMSGDDNGLPTLDVIEKLGKVSLGLGALNFAWRKPN